MEKIDVQVLLATYNGEDFLSDFLLSLANQKGVNVHLLVSDDGSTDRTLEIINQTKSFFASTQVIKGPQMGASENFFSLLKWARFPYVAFADQDDLWDDVKLIRAIQILQKLKSDKPLLYVGSVRTNESGNLPCRNYEYPLSLFRNHNHGMTFLLNSKMCELINKMQISKYGMYDWATLIVAQSQGEVIFDQTPFATYRIHSNNLIGSPSLVSKLKHYCNFKNIQLRRNFIISQVREISIGLRKLGKSDPKLENFHRLIEGSLKDRLKLIAKCLRANNFPVATLFFCVLIVFSRSSNSKKNPQQHF